MNNLNPPHQVEFDIESMRVYMAFSVEEKLKYLEQLNELARALMPEINRKIWEQLQQKGF